MWKFFLALFRIFLKYLLLLADLFVAFSLKNHLAKLATAQHSVLFV